MTSKEDKAKADIFFSVIDEILRLQSCFENLFVEVQSLSHLSTLQKLVLFSVFDSPVPPTVPQIGRNLGHPRQVIRRVVNELVSDGLLERAANPHHRRAALLVPTAKAEEMRQRAEARAVETARAFLGTVSAARCASLTGELRAFRETIEAYSRSEQEGARRTEPASSVARVLALL